jgi:hypothetical protein
VLACMSNYRTNICRRSYEPYNILYHSLTSTHESKNKFRDEKRAIAESSDGQTAKVQRERCHGHPLTRSDSMYRHDMLTACNPEALDNQCVRFLILSTTKPRDFY